MFSSTRALAILDGFEVVPISLTATIYELLALAVILIKVKPWEICYASTTVCFKIAEIWTRFCKT